MKKMEEEAYMLLAKIRKDIETFFKEKSEEDEIIQEEDMGELLTEIYEEINKNIPKKYIILEGLD